MKKIAQILFVLIPILLIFFSCTKEYSDEGNHSSTGYLVKDNRGNCSTITVAGIYVAGKKLTDSNFMQVQVHVTKAGNYNVWTDTLNGFSFSASGSFPDTGNIQVKLAGKGSPTMEPQIASVGYTPNTTGELYTFYYAKGVGLIYESEANMYYTQSKLQIRNWVVF